MGILALLSSPVACLQAQIPPGNLASTSISLWGSPDPATFGSPVTLTATVSPGAATGKVTFYDGVNVIGITPLSAGSASLSTVMLPAGSRTLKAYYSGDASYAPATSLPEAQTINTVAWNLFAVNRLISNRALKTVAVGDFNSDGKPDLVIPDSVLPGNGDGTFQNPLSLPAITGVNAIAV